MSCFVLDKNLRPVGRSVDLTVPDTLPLKVVSSSGPALVRCKKEDVQGRLVTALYIDNHLEARSSTVVEYGFVSLVYEHGRVQLKYPK